MSDNKSQKKINFHFVTGVPQTDSEKRNVRTIVRSNASNRRWRLVRESAAKSKSQSPEIQKERVPSVTDSEISSVGSIHNETQQAPARQARRQKLDNKQTRRASKTLSITSLESPRKVANLSQYFFPNMPMSEVSKQSISRMLQGTAASYAQLFPGGKNVIVSQMARDWFQQCLKTRGILHTALFCQAMRAQAMRPGWAALPGNELVLCQTEAVHAITDKLSQTDTACDDESIRIVFSLTWHGAIKQDPLPRGPRQAPMADLQALRLFMGMIRPDPLHSDGLERLIQLRGGLKNVEMPGLAFLVSFGDILMATCNLTRPKWDYASYAQYVPEAVAGDEWLWSTHRTDHPLKTLGGGFSRLHIWLPYAKATSLQLVLNDLADYTRATHDFIHGPPENRNRAAMANQRNFVQHKLMSLCPLQDDRLPERDIFELCWLAGVAYSMIIVFPLSPKGARFDRLAHLIRQKLLAPTVVEKWLTVTELVAWITVVGSLCAIGTADRPWFVYALRQEVEQLGITSWESLKGLLQEFLWFPLTSDPDGEELWAEVDQLGRVVPLESPDSTSTG